MKKILSLKSLSHILLSCAIFMSIGFLNSFLSPKFRQWILAEVIQRSDSHLPITIYPTNMNLNFWPLGLRFTNVRILPKGDLAKKISPIQIGEVRLELHPLKLLTGRLGISEIILQDPSLAVLRPKDPPSPQASSLKNETFQNYRDLIQSILKLPIYRLNIVNMTLMIKDSLSDLRGKMSGLSLTIDSRLHSLILDLSTQNLALKKGSDSSSVRQVNVDLHANLSPSLINISNFRFKKDHNHVNLRFKASGDLNNIPLTELSFDTDALVNLREIRSLAKVLFPNMQIPELGGYVQTRLRGVQKPNEKPNVELLLRSVRLAVDQFQIGRLSSSANLSNNELAIEKLTIQNPAGQVSLPHLKMDLQTRSGTLQLSINSIEISRLLVQLGLKKIPVHLGVSGDLPCDFSLIDEPRLNCRGKLTAKDFHVFDENTQKTVISVRQIVVDGGVVVDRYGVRPEASLAVGAHSRGIAKGFIDYETGFNFTYETPRLLFSDIENLADLNLEGEVKINGRTSGTGEAATVNLTIEPGVQPLQSETSPAPIWFDGYGIGQLSSLVSYQKGLLKFGDIKGSFQSSQYAGQVGINLPQKQIQGELKFPKLELNDLQRALSKKYELPVQVIGSGEGEAKFAGPLDFPHLTYQVKSSFFRGTLAQDSFDAFHFDLQSHEGFVKSQRIVLNKNKSSIELVGTVNPTGQIDATIKGHRILIEESESIQKSAVNLNGVLNFNSVLTGHLPKPDFNLEGGLSQTQLGTDPVPDSSFNLRITEKSTSLVAKILGGDLKIDSVFPLTENSPFYFNVSAHRWNFSPLMSLISRDIDRTEYDAELTGKIEIKSDTGGFWNATGRASIDAFRLNRGSLEIFSPQPLLATMKNGSIDITHFLIQGDNTNLEAKAKGLSKNDFSASIKGKIELGLLNFLTPFLSELRGTLSVSCQTKGTVDKVSVLGTAFLDGGFAKPKAIAHSLDDLRIDLDFSEERLLLNRLETKTAGGTLAANGIIEFKGTKFYTTKINGNLSNVELALPKGVTSKGSGDFKITGNWFPYLFSANYVVESGLVTTNFIDDTETTTTNVRRSDFLPPLLLQKSFEPFETDIKIQFEKGVDVKNTYFDSKVTGNLNIRGTPDLPIVLGEVTAVEKGKLFFRDVPFVIQGANLKFTDPKENNPIIYALANAQVRDRVQEYQVTLLVQGTAKKNQITLKSQPPLPDQDLVTLLALGYTNNRDSISAVTADQQASRESFELGSALLSQNPLNSELRKRYGLDVKFSSSIDRLNNAAVSKVVLSKQWTPKIGTSASRTIGTKVIQDVKLEYLLDKNVSVIGSWEGRGFDEEAGDRVESLNFFGLDLQYKVDFK